MKRNKLMVAVAAGLVGLSALGGTVAVAQGNGNSGDAIEMQAFAQSSMSITDAIQAAESETGGKAISAEFNTDDSQTGTYEVEIVGADGAMTYAMVHVADGSVQTMAPSADNDEGQGVEGDDDDNAQNGDRDDDNG